MGRVTTDQMITVYSAWWCQYCANLKLRLKVARIDYEAIEVGRDPDASAFCRAANGGKKILPTVRFPDGSTLTNPSVSSVRAKLRDSRDQQDSGGQSLGG
jgi:mycoredoxin